MKKRLLCAALLALALTLALSACGGGQGGEGSAHPWKWTKKGDGISLTIKNPPDDGFAWTCVDASSGLVTVSRTDDGSGQDATFAVSGAGFGGGTVRFVCRREAEPNDAAFTLTMAFAVDEKGRLGVSSQEYTQNSSAGSIGEADGQHAVWYVTDEGLTEIYASSADWSVLGYNDSLLSVSSPEYLENGCIYTLKGLDAGTTDLYIYDLRADSGYRFGITTGTDLTAAIDSCEAGTFTFAAEATPGYDEAQALVGDIALPDGVSAIRTHTGAWHGNGEADYAEIRLRENGRQWTLTMTKSYTRDELAALIIGSEKNVKQTKAKLGEREVLLCGDENSFVMLWNDDAGRAFALSPLDDGTTQEMLSTLAQSIISAQ